MTKPLYEMIMSGKKTNYYEKIKIGLIERFSLIKLPMLLIEQENAGDIKVEYKGQAFYFNEDSETDELQLLFDFLLKISPKTGNICKCSDCKNCPSKSVEKVSNIIVEES